MASVNIHCPRCQSAQVYRHGQNPKGRDRFRCRDCHRVFQLTGNDSNLLIVFYVQIMPDDFVMQLHRF